jgi:hypothetical protein
MTAIQPHTHTTYCDGMNTPGNADAAIMKGFRTLGLFGPCTCAFDPSYCMTPLGALPTRRRSAACARSTRDASKSISA